MKHSTVTSTLLLCLTQALPAQAQNASAQKEPTLGRIPAPARAPLGASIFYVLTSGASENYTPGHWAIALQDRSITPEEDRTLWTYARQVRDSNLAFQRSEMDKLCANRSSLTSMDAVAAALTTFDQKNAANIDQLGNGAPKALSPRLGKLLAAAGQNSTFMVLETDHKEVMASRNREPVAHINSVCAK